MKFTKSKSIKKKSAYDEKYLWPIFSLFSRLKDTDDNGYGNCFTCGKSKHFSEADAGHGIGRQHKSTKYHEFNVHLQDKRCNGFEAGARDVYAVNVDKKYGKGTWDVLTLLSRQTCKRAEFEYDVMTEYYFNEVVKLCKEKSIDHTQLPAMKRWVSKKKAA